MIHEVLSDVGGESHDCIMFALLRPVYAEAFCSAIAKTQFSNGPGCRSYAHNARTSSVCCTVKATSRITA